MAIDYRLVITTDTELYTPVDPRLHRVSIISPLKRRKELGSQKLKYSFWKKAALFATISGAGMFFRAELEDLLKPVSNFIAVSMGI